MSTAKIVAIATYLIKKEKLINESMRTSVPNRIQTNSVEKKTFTNKNTTYSTNVLT